MSNEVQITGVIQVLLMVGKLIGLPYLGAASWWVIMLPTLLPLGGLALAGIYVLIYAMWESK